MDGADAIELEDSRGICKAGRCAGVRVNEAPGSRRGASGVLGGACILAAKILAAVDSART